MPARSLTASKAVIRLAAMTRTTMATALLVCGAAPAYAQDTDTDTDTDTAAQNEPTEGLTITWTPVSVNLEDCEDDAHPKSISVKVKATIQQSVGVDNKLFIWHASSGTCTTSNRPSDGDLVAEETLKADHPLVTDDTLDFPDDVKLNSNTSGDFTTLELIEKYAVCDETPIDADEKFLCFGVSVLGYGSTTADDEIDSNEPLGWVRFYIDTVRPPDPEEIKVTALDSALRIDGEMSEETDDVSTWIARMREVSDTETEESTACQDWDEKYKNEYIEGTSANGSVELAGENTVTYRVCMFVRDKAGNESESSVFGEGTPIDECDFIECYPGELQVGHCGATPAGSSVLAAMAIAVLRRRQRRLRR